LPSSLEFSFIWPLFRRRWIRPAPLVDDATRRKFHEAETSDAHLSASDRDFRRRNQLRTADAPQATSWRGASVAPRNAHKRERIARARRNASRTGARVDNNRDVHALSSLRFPTARNDHKIAANQGVGVRDAARVIVHVGKRAPM